MAQQHDRDATRPALRWMIALGATVTALVLGGCGDDRASATAEGVCAQRLGADLAQLSDFLHARCYEENGWEGDPRIRATGPTVDGAYYSVHGDVRVWYAPEILAWLRADRPAGGIPDGALIVKEQYAGPGTPDPQQLQGWTFMLKDARASWDGWYWGYIDVTDPVWNVGEFFLQYCVGCHASSDSKELTFVSLRNLAGDGPDFSALDPDVHLPLTRSHAMFDDGYAAMKAVMAETLPSPLPEPRADFLALFPSIAAQTEEQILALPEQRFDHVVPAQAPREFVTADVCAGCHDADSLLHGAEPNMLVTAHDERLNLSPYGEWSASLMGLSGRDPVFHAQLESEWTLHPEIADFTDHFCFTCHGAMGHRQVDADTGGSGFLTLAMTYATGSDPNAPVAALARDGVSCAVCHRIAPDGLGTPATFTGAFQTGPATEIYGPYANPTRYPMENALGMTPRESATIRSSALCGSCHVVVLPVLERDVAYTPARVRAQPTVHEQTTYLEWLNSVYQNERAPIAEAEARTCQDCHMPRTLDDAPLAVRIANIQDATYPRFDHVAPDEALVLPRRTPYGRHTLVAGNVFVMQMFQQWSDLLGVAATDENIASNERPLPSLLRAGREAEGFASTRSAAVRIDAVQSAGGALETTVTVQNLTGHKLPSGVGFRRAFLELAVLDGGEQVLWASGRTTPLGVIVDGDGTPLATELSQETVAPHHDVITREDEVQIYETRHRDSSGALTTSFLALSDEVKDNRLLPRGWSPSGPYASVTGPHELDDPRYLDGSGSDQLVYRVPLAAIPTAARVRATLYYQTIPPYYLADRFRLADGPETRRLHFIASRLDVGGTAIDDWKLALGSASAVVPGSE